MGIGPRLAIAAELQVGVEVVFRAVGHKMVGATSSLHFRELNAATPLPAPIWPVVECAGNDRSG